MKSSSFFEKYAHEYDLLTDANNRTKLHEKEVTAMIERFKPKIVLDAGCGTGLTTVLFAKHGVQAVGLDRSRPMLTEAKRKYAKLGLPLQFRYGHFERLPKSLSNRFDLVVCLANSIVGVGSLRNLQRTLTGFSAALKPKGALILQMLNYESIKEGDLHPIKATEARGIVYERFTERRGTKVMLYVTRVDLNQQPSKLEVFRHEFDNFTFDEVRRGLERAGFQGVHIYADLLFTKRFSKTARDLVITAEKRN
jgi:ubiquinone/menaquinone biosynthesis C-methylase UbiE